MRIALDLRMVTHPLHGIARYALELGRRLPSLDPESRFDLIVARGLDASALGPLPENATLVRAHSRFLSVAEQVELPWLLARLRPDLYHSTSFSVPAAWRGPLALTLHDANHLAFPERYGPLHGVYYRRVVRPGALRAQAVLTVSRFAQGEIERRLELPAGRLRVVYNGVDAAFHPASPADVDLLRRRLALPDRFVLYVGNAKPHKNVGCLVDAFRRLPGDVSLVLCVGRDGRGLRERAGPAAARVRLLDDLSDADLPLLYAAASAFAFPSLYEGFGLPPLEAMACGTPVAAARATALPEVLGDAAEYFEPSDPGDLAAALLRLLSDERRAASLRQAGLARAATFTWERTAREVLDAYREQAAR